MARLKRMGVEVDAAHVYTAAAATVDHVLERFGGGRGSQDRPGVFNLSTEGVQEMLEGKVRWCESERDDLRRGDLRRSAEPLRDR